MKILFKYPTFRRPEWFERTLNLYYSMISSNYTFEFLITLNENDKTMNTEKMRSFMSSYSHLRYKFGKHKNKIEAINADMEKEDFDILFLVSDDMIPIVPGFDIVIIEKMMEYFPDLDGALHFGDGVNKDPKTISSYIIGKKLYDRFGYIYHPDYKSFFCDTEFTYEIRRMNKVIFFPEKIIRHCYKEFGTDKVYDRNSKLGRKDKQIYIKRKKAGFPREKG